MNSQSIIHKPNEYVQPFNLDLFGKVMQYKQSQYDAGAAAIQGDFGSISKLPIMGNAPKQYLSQKINETLTEVNSMGGTDFSDATVVNQIRGQIGRITNDPIIENAIQSSAKIQKRQAAWEKIKADYAAGKKGVYFSEANYASDMEDINNYLKQAEVDPNATYNGTSDATPYKDFMKEMREIAKSQVASKVTSVGADGKNSYLYLTKSGEYVSPETLWNSVMKQISPESLSQIQRNAKFMYLRKDANGNTDPLALEGLVSQYTNVGESRVKALEARVNELNATKASGGTADEKIKIQKEIDLLKSDISSRKQKLYDVFSKSPTAAASDVYMNKLLEGIVSNYSYHKEDLKPMWNQGQMHIDKMNQQDRMFNEKMQLDKNKLELEALKSDYQIKYTENGAIFLPINSSSNAGFDNVQQENSTSFEKDNIENTVKSENAALQKNIDNVIKDYWASKGIENPEMFDKKASSLAPGGFEYVPKKQYADLFNKEMEQLKLMASGKPLAISNLSPEFVNVYSKMKPYLMKQLSNSNLINSVEQSIKKDITDLNGISSNDYEAYKLGKKLSADLSSKIPTVTGPGAIPNFQNAPNISKKDKIYLQTYYKYKDLIEKKHEDLSKKYWANMENRVVPNLINFTDKEMKSPQLKTRIANVISNRGFYSSDFSSKPEDNANSNYAPEDITVIGKTIRNLGDGDQKFIKAQITKTVDGDKVVNTVYVPLDEQTAKAYGEFNKGPDHVLADVLDFNQEYSDYSLSKNGDVALKYRVFKLSPNDPASPVKVSVQVPIRNSKGEVTSTTSITLPMIVDKVKAYTFAENLSESYNVAKKAAKAKGINLSINEYIKQLTKTE